MIYNPHASLYAPVPSPEPLRWLQFVLALCLFSFLSASSKAETWPSGLFPIRNDPNNEEVIVFVHGVTGNSKAKWTNDFTGKFWPEMLRDDDPAFNGINIFVYGYNSPRLGPSLTIGEQGDNLETMLSEHQIFNHKKIIFIMRSMGGLIVGFCLTNINGRIG